jgi:hypothetical protein
VLLHDDARVRPELCPAPDHSFTRPHTFSALLRTPLCSFSDGSPGAQVYSIPVSGCSDSGLLSVAGYVATHKAALALHCTPGKAVSLGLLPGPPKPPSVGARRGSTRSVATTGTVAGAAAAATAAAAAGGGGDAALAPVVAPAPAPAPPVVATLPAAVAAAPDVPCGTHFTPADAAFLMRWLNGCVLRQPISAFPQDLCASHGRPIIEALEGLSGRVLAGRVTGRVPTSKKERSIVLLTQVRCCCGARCCPLIPAGAPRLCSDAAPPPPPPPLRCSTASSSLRCAPLVLC